MKLKKIHQRRLLKLAKFLRETVAPAADELRDESLEDLFTMGNWLGADKNGHQHRRASIKCGTSACAAGWATAVFPELFYDLNHCHIHLKGRRCTNYHGDYNYVGEFFLGINDRTRHRSETDAVIWLFGGDHERTAEQEADVIERFVKENT